MYFFRFITVPNSAHPDYDRIGQSHINCWVDRPTLDDAYRFAKDYIRDANWLVNEPDEACEVSREFYEDDSPHLEYYERALTEKKVFVFVTSPKRRS